MFNGNTSSDFADLEETLDLIDYQLRACGFIHQAALAYYPHHTALYGAAPAGEEHSLLAAIEAFLQGLGAYKADLAKLHRGAVKDFDRATSARYVKGTIPAELRWEVWERDDFTCRRCGTRRNLSVDHIHPERHGGTLEHANLQTLCKSCNSRKGARHA